MYESPICVTLGDIQHQMEEQNEGEILRVVWKCGVNVDKEELLKALKYDREQYEKGYRDAKEEPPRWISCSEMLPEIDELVLVTDDSGGIKTVDVDRCGQYENSNKRFWYCTQNAVAWMSLPEPYKEDERC